MSDWKRTPPDFLLLPLVKRESIFYTVGMSDFLRLPASPAHEGFVNWLGFITVYEDDKGVLAGQEFVFFGRHKTLQFWGLKGEERYAFFAVLKDGRWLPFERKRYEPAINAIAPDVDPALMLGARILVKDLGNQKAVILENTVWRAT